MNADWNEESGAFEIKRKPRRYKGVPNPNSRCQVNFRTTLQTRQALDIARGAEPLSDFMHRIVFNYLEELNGKLKRFTIQYQQADDEGRLQHTMVTIMAADFKTAVINWENSRPEEAQTLSITEIQP